MIHIGRPLEFDPREALEAALQLFWSKGYKTTSLQDLLKTMNLSKSSFYQTFGSKHQLFEQCIILYCRKVAEELTGCLAKSPSALTFIKNVFYGIAEETLKQAERRGCLVMNSASEFAQRDPVIADLVTRGTKEFVNVFFNAIKQAQKENDIPMSKDASALAHFLVTNMSGLKSLVKAGIDKSTVKKIVGVIMTTLA